METYKIILAPEIRNKQEVVLRAILETYGQLDRARAAAIVTDLLAGSEVAIQGFSRDETAQLIGRIQPHGVRYSIEPDECPTCHSPLTRVLSRWPVWVSEKQHASISSGRTILGPDDGKPAPDYICLACFPEWREFHRLAIEYNDCQLGMEEAVAAQDFEKAVFLRDRRNELRPRFKALMDRLRGRN